MSVVKFLVHWLVNNFLTIRTHVLRLIGSITHPSEHQEVWFRLLCIVCDIPFQVLILVLLRLLLSSVLVLCSLVEVLVIVAPACLVMLLVLYWRQVRP